MRLKQWNAMCVNGRPQRVEHCYCIYHDDSVVFYLTTARVLFCYCCVFVFLSVSVLCGRFLFCLSLRFTSLLSFLAFLCLSATLHVCRSVCMYLCIFVCLYVCLYVSLCLLLWFIFLLPFLPQHLFLQRSRPLSSHRAWCCPRLAHTTRSWHPSPTRKASTSKHLWYGAGSSG